MADDHPILDRPALTTERYPWHDALWSALEHRFDRLPHALLLHGRPGLGKHVFAFQLAQALLCAQPQAGAACGKCHGCQLFAAGTHPDLSALALPEDAKSITIDQIRALGGFLSLRPHTATRKVVIISPAEAMNLNAANSLLKLLEEPPLGSMLLLVTSHPVRLPATIRSRCSGVLFKSPARGVGLAWLQSRPEGKTQPEILLDLAAGAPLLAEVLAREGFLENRVKLLQDLKAMHSGRDEPVACATRWKNLGIKRCLGWLYGLVSELIKVQMGRLDAVSANSEALFLLEKNKYEIRELYGYIDVIHENYRRLGGPLDELLMLEDVLIGWARLRRLQ